MPVSARYTPEHAALDQCVYGCDFAPLLPPGVGINPQAIDSDFSGLKPAPRLEIYLNAAGNAVPVPQDWWSDPRVTAFAPGWYWAQQGVQNAGVIAWIQADPRGATNAGVGVPVLALGVAVRNKRVYSVLRGGLPGIDYLFVWYIIDTLGNRWSRSIPVLCGPTQ